MSAVRELDPSQLENDVLQADKPVVLDFYSDTCPPCQALKPVLEKLASRFQGRATVLKVNVMNAYDLAARFGIFSVPTLLFFNNGKLADASVGLVAPEMLEGKLNAMLATSSHQTTH